MTGGRSGGARVGIRTELRRARAALLVPTFALLLTVLVAGTVLSVRAASENSDEIAALGAQAVDDRLAQSTTVLEISLTDATTEVEDAARLLAVALRNDPALTAVTLYRPDGLKVAALDRFQVTTRLGDTLPAVAERALLSGGRTVGEIRFDEGLRFDVVDVAVVVDDGVAVGVVRLDNVSEVLETLAATGDADVYLVRDGDVVLHPDLSFQQFDRTIGVDRLITTGLDGRRVVRGSVPLSATDGVVVADRPLVEALAVVIWATLVLVAFSAGLTALSVRGWRRLERSVVEPIDELIDSASAIQAGAWTAAGEESIGRTTGVVELDELRLAVDEMGAEIQRRIDAMETANLQLAASNRDLEDFAYAASHDLQAPLRSISGFLDLYDEALRDAGVEPNERAVHLRDRVDDGVRSMYQLIDGLLAYSRITSRGDELDAEVDLGACVHTVLQALSHDLDEAGAAVEVGALPTVHGDPVQLRQLFQNLVENSLKFRSPDRPLEITLWANRRHGSWEISVRDTGIGFRPEFHDRVFVMFRRLNPADRYPGQGLGLALCRRIAERHGGTIWARAVPDVGATFTVSLPDRAARPEAP